MQYAFYPLGTSLTAVPFVKLGAWLGHDSLEAKQFAFSLTTVPVSAAVISLLFLIYGRLGRDLRGALGGSLVVAFCTPVWPYAGSSFDTGLQAFWLLGAVWATVEALTADSRWWALASGISFAMLVNIQEAYAALGACVVAVFPLTWRTVGDRLRLPVVRQILFGLLAGIVLVLSYNAFKFGNPLDTGRTSVPHPLVGNPLIGFAGLFFSPAKSIFIYSPTYVLALVGLRRLTRKDGWRFAALAACLGIHIALVSTLKFWAGEWAWGPRYLIASVPLACVGLPFAAVGQIERRVFAVLCGLGVLVQLLAISVDHQRFYFERSLSPFFWVDESSMYKQSPLLARPSELIAVWQGRDLGHVRALVPGPRPFSMTSSVFGPGPARLPQAPDWMREYLVFLVPRPWPLWSRFLAADQRPGRTGLMTVIGSLIAMASFGTLFNAVYRWSRHKFSEGQQQPPG